MKFILILFFTYSVVLAQGITVSRLDSMFNEYIRIKVPSSTEGAVTKDSYEKCGFGIVNLVHNNFEKFTPDQQLILQKLSSPPVLPKSIMTASGLFKVHYDTAGTNAIKYDLNLLLEAIDFCYDYEVHFLGYPPPPTNGSGVYDIYVQNIGNTYGYTETGDIVDGKLTSFIVLDNDFLSTATKGINGARVTMAHELHHAIQIGNYKFAEDDIYFHELSSTAMEEFVYDNINDYYYYMDEYFSSPEQSFASHTGYDLAIWNIFLAGEFGFGILKRQWDHIIYRRALDAIAFSISEAGSNFQDVFNKFGIWVFFTNYKKIQGKYFEEGAEYPPVQVLMKKTFTPPSDTLTISAEPVSHNYFSLYNSNDTMTVLISNSDYKSALLDPGILQQASYELSTDSSDGMNFLAEGYYQRLSTGTPGVFWATSEFLNNQLIKAGYVNIKSLSPFPSPFRYSSHNVMYFPVKPNAEGEVELQIYSISMDLVYSERKDISFMFGKEIVSWDVKSDANQKLGSGVYLYVIKSGDDISKGKIVLFND